MQHAEKRNEFAIHGVFILAAMLLCLLSTATFALAADGDGIPPTPPEQGTLTEGTDAGQATEVTPESIVEYLEAQNLDPTLLKEMKTQIEAIGDDPEALGQLMQGIQGSDPNAPSPLSGEEGGTPFINPAAFALPQEALANMTEGQRADYGRMQEAFKEGDMGTAREIMAQYEGHEGGAGFPGFESDRPGGPEGGDHPWSQDWNNQEGGGDFFIGNEHWGNQDNHADNPEQWQGQSEQDWSGNQFEGPGEYEMPYHDPSAEHSSEPQYEPEYQNQGMEFEGSQQEQQHQEPEQYQQEQDYPQPPEGGQDWQHPEGQDYQPPQP